MRIVRTGVSAITALALAAGLAACGGSDDTGSAAAEGSGGEGMTEAADSTGGKRVTIKTFNFRPDPIEVEAGTTVVWNNQDSIGHTVTSGDREALDGRFDSGTFGKGEEFRHTFDEPGRYQYVCTIHPGPGMEAEVVVTR